MNCSPYRHLLDEHLQGTLDAALCSALDAHLAGCSACRDERDFLRGLQQDLRALPVPPPSADFEQRVLGKLRAAQGLRAPASRPRAAVAVPFALAASLLVALGFFGAGQRVPEFDPAAGEPLRLVFNSESALRGVQFELELPEGVELEGYPGERRVVWRSDLDAGSNLLELPVRARGGEGLLTATLVHGSEVRRFEVRVVGGVDRA